MAILTLDQKPTIADEIIIGIDTPDADGCFLANPYMVDSVKIYYVQRTFSGNDTQYDKQFYDQNVKAKLDAAIALACADASPENLRNVQILTTEFDQTIKLQSFYFDNALPVKIVGTPDYPAWLSSDLDNAQLLHLTTDSNGVTQYGKFQYQWNPLGMREGDYFLCWTWTPNISGDKLNSSLCFTLGGSTQITTSIPTHQTAPDKYATLLDRYLPEIFKTKILSGDLAPKVLRGLNNSVADGFTFLEDQANQIIDLIDANSVNQTFLPHLAGTFGLNLYSSDPTLWRRQIKNAIPLFKQKGTLAGLTTALSQAGITLTRYSQMWEIQSKYTFQELFVVDDSTNFQLSRSMILPVDIDNFELYYRPFNSNTWSALNSDYVHFTISGSVVTMYWVGDSLSVGAITLQQADSIRVVYKVVLVPNDDQQTIENYVRALPLMDERDERSQDYPAKNWNTRLIEDDDVLFDLIVPNRNPFFDPLMYGWVRTEFAYSENVFNMDEYNGSIRESLNQCDIDKGFISPCYSCISSNYVLDLQIANLSNDRIIEAQKIITDYTPFHAILHSINLTGQVDEFVLSPVESIGENIRYNNEDFTISGDAQLVFNRMMLAPDQILRNELANIISVDTNTGTVSNTSISLYAPNLFLEGIGLDDDSTYTYLEVLAPSPNTGAYRIKNPTDCYAEYDQTNLIDTLNEPLNQSAFTFRLSNERLTKSSTSIYQDNLFYFTDLNINLVVDNIATLKETNAWKVSIPAYSDVYQIADILPSGQLILADPSKTLPTSNTSGITYTLLNNSNTTILSGTTGRLTVTSRGRVDLTGTVSIRGVNETFTTVQSLFDGYQGNFSTSYLKYSCTQYPVIGLSESNSSQFYIGCYTGGDVAGAAVVLYNRLANNRTGYFNYSGLQLFTPVNYETSLGIANGEHPIATPLENSKFKENFLILINTEYYSMEDISHQTITLSGPMNDWTTTGTSVSYTILNYQTLGADIAASDFDPPHPAYNFDQIDRRGGEPCEILTPNSPVLSALMAQALNKEGNERIEVTGQQESITFSIEMVE